MTHIVSYKPANGSVVGSRPALEMVVYWTEATTSAEQAQARFVFTKGGTTLYRSAFIAQPVAGQYYTFTSFSASNPADLEDGTWTVTPQVIRQIWPSGQIGSGQPTGGLVTLNPATSPASVNINVTSVPSVTQLTPPVDDVVPIATTDPANPTAHNASFSWQFGSTNPSDYAILSQVEVRRQSDAVGVATKSVNDNRTNTNIALPAAQIDNWLEWRVRSQNRFNIFSAWTGWRRFKYASPPTSSITSPTLNQVLTSGAINFTTSATTVGGKSVTKVRAEVWQDTVLLWSGTYTGTWASGASVPVMDPLYVLPETGSGAPYNLRVWHWDSENIQSSGTTRNFTVAYTPVNSPGVTDVSATTYDDTGKVVVQWGNSAVDANFYAWVVERRHRFLDPNTLVAYGSFTAWEEVGQVYTAGSTNVFNDYTALSQTAVEYRVRQTAIRDGILVTSSTATAYAAVNCLTSSYWIVNLVVTTTGTVPVVSDNGIPFRLYNVTGDSYTRERERAEYNLMNRGRYIEEGDFLGIRGQLDAQLRDGQGLLARDKLDQIEALQLASSRFLLRDPFGNRVTMNMGDLGVTRVAGTGRSEFVDISFPYVEVM